MIITFQSDKFAKDCNDDKRRTRRFGPKRAALLKQRLDELVSCPVLKVMTTLPKPRCHELKGNHAGHLSVDLDHPYRLIFEPAINPTPKRKDGGLDWEKVEAISIIGIEDTHE